MWKIERTRNGVTDHNQQQVSNSPRTFSIDQEPLNDLDLLRNCHGGEKSKEAFNSILMKYRSRLIRIISLRIGLRLQGRVDASDVIQDAFVEASRTLDRYLENPEIPVFLWLRRLAGEKLLQANRFHLDAQKRNAGREVSIDQEMPQACSLSLATKLVGSATSPSEIAIRNENKRLLETALNQMDSLDREVLVLRHFEHLSGRESAIVMNMGYEAVKKRYSRALDKLERILSSINDTSEFQLEVDSGMLTYYQDRR